MKTYILVRRKQPTYTVNILKSWSSDKHYIAKYMGDSEIVW